MLNTLRPRQICPHFADDIFKCSFMNENGRILLNISLKFVLKVRINTDDVPALVQIMVWRCPGDKPLSEPMMVRLSTHICVTRPQWVKGRWHLVLQSLCHWLTQKLKFWPTCHSKYSGYHYELGLYIFWCFLCNLISYLSLNSWK